MAYYTIYKITNKLDSKYYIGQHVTENLEDGYMGSGKLICRAIKKYGKENFIKEYIAFCDSIEEMNKLEENMVITIEQDPNSYNLTKGGNKPPLAKKGRACKRPKFVNGYGYKHTEEALQKIREWTIKNQPMRNPESRKKLSETKTGVKLSEQHRRAISESHKGLPSPKKGTKLSKEHKNKLSESKLSKRWKWKLDPTTNKRLYYQDGN